MSEAHEPPGLPNVVDEAADTPPWIPRLGLGLLAAAVLYFIAVQFVASRSNAPAEPTPAAETG